MYGLLKRSRIRGGYDRIYFCIWKYKKSSGNSRKQVKRKGMPKVVVHDLAREDLAAVVEDAFRNGSLVPATTTYNADIFPFMRTFIEHLTERNYQKRTIGLIENGSWAPMAIRTIKGMFEKCRNLTWLRNEVKILSSVSEENMEQMEKMADDGKEYVAQSSETANKNDLTALFI